MSGDSDTSLALIAFAIVGVAPFAFLFAAATWIDHGKDAMNKLERAIGTTAEVVASQLRLDPEHVGAAIAAGISSTTVTGRGVVAGLLVGATATGHASSPAAVVSFGLANLWTVSIAIVTAGIRAHGAYREAVAAGIAALPPEPPPTAKAAA